MGEGSYPPTPPYLKKHTVIYLTHSLFQSNYVHQVTHRKCNLKKLHELKKCATRNNCVFTDIHHYYTLFTTMKGHHLSGSHLTPTKTLTKERKTVEQSIIQTIKQTRQTPWRTDLYALTTYFPWIGIISKKSNTKFCEKKNIFPQLKTRINSRSSLIMI